MGVLRTSRKDRPHGEERLSPADAQAGDEEGAAGMAGISSGPGQPGGRRGGEGPSPHPEGLGVPSRAVPALQAPLGALHPSPTE